MKVLCLEVDDELADRLENVVPVGSLCQSEFVRAAILKALWEVEAQATAEAYARQPDSSETSFDPDLWDTLAER